MTSRHGRVRNPASQVGTDPEESDAGELTALAPAKLNIGLRILRRRPDGYHDIVTRFQAIDLYDRLSVRRESRGFRMTCSDPDLTTGPDNLVLRAARALAKATGIRGGAGFHLEKRIPFGAGLGGGSSDAAAALRLLVRLWGIRIGSRALARIARNLGADVPFFLIGGCAIGRGRGDRLEPGNLTREQHFVVVHSPHRITAKWAYFQYKRELTGTRTLHRMAKSKVGRRPSGKFLNNPANDLQPGVLAHYPDLRQNLDQLQVLGASACAMTGSGSSVFGIFPDRSAAVAAARRLERKGNTVTLARSIREGVVILENHRIASDSVHARGRAIGGTSTRPVRRHGAHGSEENQDTR